MLGLTAIICFAVSVRAQVALIKAGGFLAINPGGDGGGRSIIDLGLECKINKSFSAQLSLSGSDLKFIGQEIKSKKVVSLQARYYYLARYADDFPIKPFVGLVAQKVKRELTEFVSTYPDYYTKLQEDSQKTALGIITGQNLFVYKRFGLDTHLGLVGELGKKTRITKENANTAALTNVKRHDFSIRPFWGLNVFVALGKMPPKKSKG